MVRSLGTLVSLALVAVLAGAPIAAFACAEWCAPSRQHADTLSRGEDHSRHQLGTAALGAATDCHGRGAGAGLRLAARLAPECLDYTLTDRDAGPVTPRLLVSQPLSSALLLCDAGLAVSARPLDTGPGFAHASPPRPLSASLVLRI